MQNSDLEARAKIREGEDLLKTKERLEREEDELVARLLASKESKVIKLQGFGDNSTYSNMSNPAARAALLKGNDPITADE